MVYLLNSPVLTGYGNWVFKGPVSVGDVKNLLADGFVSGIGHASTAQFLSELLALPVDINRHGCRLNVGDMAIVFRLLERQPEGKLLSYEELKQLPSAFGVLQLRSE